MPEKKTGKQKAARSVREAAKRSTRKASPGTKPKAGRETKTAPGGSVARKAAPAKPLPKEKTKTALGKRPATGQQPDFRKDISKSPVSAVLWQAEGKTHGMSEKEREAALRRLLIQKRGEMMREVKSEISKYIKGETRQLVDTALDDGDWSVVDLSEDISFKHMSSHRDDLLKIDEALRKLGEGTYGICEDCGEEISEKRLQILPFAIYCTDCQEHREQMEELGKRENLI